MSDTATMLNDSIVDPVMASILPLFRRDSANEEIFSKFLISLQQIFKDKPR